MSTEPLTWTENYKITSYLVNLRKQAGLYSILNFIQDVGWQHGFQLGVQLPDNHGWVFTRQKLVMERWPQWNDTLKIKTWLREPEGAFLFRDYELYLNDTKIGMCTSSFTVMDQISRKLAIQDWYTYPRFWKTESPLTNKPDKIPLKIPAEDISQFEVRNSDIDLNEHVNNTKYAQWILDSLPINNLKGGVELKGYEVNFLAEMKLGDVITIQKTLDESPNLIQFQGQRMSDQKPVFTAQLLVK
ncbi:MAG: acyl-[acyl-carrier-protein] thioesterase [Bdellovibrionaceae bacterium]|nr:acyl-[acyl-carrier-protein] thioesterase [Pseudobdellovibrionaceae bacterium]